MPALPSFFFAFSTTWVLLRRTHFREKVMVEILLHYLCTKSWSHLSVLGQVQCKYYFRGRYNSTDLLPIFRVEDAFGNGIRSVAWSWRKQKFCWGAVSQLHIAYCGLCAAYVGIFQKKKLRLHQQLSLLVSLVSGCFLFLKNLQKRWNNFQTWEVGNLSLHDVHQSHGNECHASCGNFGKVLRKLTRNKKNLRFSS